MRSQLFLLILSVVFGLILSACTHSSEAPEKEQRIACEKRDWFNIGRKLGARGTPFELALRTNPDCSNDEKDRDALVTGYNAGLIQFCAPEQALYLGKKGQAVSDVCPGSLTPKFKSAYEKGLQIYDLTQDNERLSLEIENAFQKMSDLATPEEKSLLEQNLIELRNKKKQNSATMSQIESEIKSL
ncbi:MAG: DUF2799 domain-containing protein [Pseudobdellovibrionaceae bacterium]